MSPTKFLQTRNLLRERIDMLTREMNECIVPSEKRRYEQCINETKKLL